MDKSLKLLLIVAFCSPLHAQILAGVLNPKAPGGATISEVMAPTGNNYSGCTSATSCAYAFATNPASGEEELVFTDQAGGGVISAPSITSSGSGCPSSWTLIVSNSPGSEVQSALWAGLAAGSGACTPTVHSTASTNIGVVEAIYSSTGSIGTDTQGSYETSSSGGAISITGNAPTAHSGEFGLTFWGTTNSTSSPSASSWSSRVNQNFQGGFSQTSIAASITVTFSGSGFASGGDISGLMVTLHP